MSEQTAVLMIERLQSEIGRLRASLVLLMPENWDEDEMFVTNREGNLAHKKTGSTDFRKYAMTPNAKLSGVSAAQENHDE